jgi:hypothetical protein
MIVKYKHLCLDSNLINLVSLFRGRVWRHQCRCQWIPGIVEIPIEVILIHF